MSKMPTVAQSPSGLTGLTSCCQATTKGCEDGICCRSCYKLVQTLAVTGKTGEQLDRVYSAWLAEALTWEDVAVFEKAVLTGNEAPCEPALIRISVADIEAAAEK